MSENLAVIPKITVVSDLMLHIEEEIGLIKNGTLKAAEGNVVMRGRGQQMKGLEMFLSACRISPKMQSQIPSALGVFPESAPEPVRIDKKKRKTA